MGLRSEEFVADAGDSLIVVDAGTRISASNRETASRTRRRHLRHGTDARPRAVNAAFDRGSNSLDLSKIPAADKSTPIITCGGGGRGQRPRTTS